MLYKLLKQKISFKQLLGFTLINIIGLTIVFLGYQLYRDVKPIVVGDDSLYDGDYIVLTKNINTLGSLFNNNSFSNKEIAQLKSQEFAEDVGEFQTSLFNIRAGIDMPGMPINISTDLFFEAVPTAFLDIKPEDWSFNPEDNVIPIIIPKSYLDLYNFGFATSRKLPQLTESTISNINLRITISSPTHFADTYKGKIVGFSKRINSILVPSEFLTYANKEYAQKESSPARIILKVKNPSDKELNSYITSRNYQVDGNQLNESKNGALLFLVTSIVLSIGILICFLSCYILILSVYLLLEKNLKTLENLSLMGYSRYQIAQPYRLLILFLNGITFIISLALVFIIRLIYLPTLNGISQDVVLTKSLSPSTYALVILSFLLLTFFSTRVIRMRINRATRFI